MLNYISMIAVPFTIFFITSYAILEKVKIFDSFLEGAKEGINTVIKIFPTLIALFLAINALRNSGILDLIAYILSPLLNFFRIPFQILPLMLTRPISGSASTAVAMDIMKTYGVDNTIRFNFFSNYGFNRNDLIHNSYLYKCCWNQKNTLCFNRCSYCRYCSV